jgi:MarR family transcriptional regulator, organic hydroperoxide resistance regulator
MRRYKSSGAKSTTQAVLRHWREAVPNDRLAHLVKDTWRGVLRAFQARLAEHAVSSGHWPFLRILWERDRLTLSELSDEAGVMVPTTFAAINAMERLGYVFRGRQSDSRRKIYVFLTPKGRELRNRLVPIAEEVNAIAVRGIPPARVSAMRRALLAMMENLAEDEIALQRMKRKVPSTRELAHVVAASAYKAPAKRSRSRNVSARQGRTGKNTLAGSRKRKDT